MESSGESILSDSISDCTNGYDTSQYYASLGAINVVFKDLPLNDVNLVVLHIILQTFADPVGRERADSIESYYTEESLITERVLLLIEYFICRKIVTLFSYLSNFNERHSN